MTGESEEKVIVRQGEATPADLTLKELEARIVAIEEKVFKKKKAAPKKERLRILGRGPIDEFADHADLLKEVPKNLQQTWIKLYPDLAWIKRQILKSEVWLQHSGYVRKNKAKFVSKWLERSWEWSPPDSLIQTSKKQPDPWKEIES